MRYASKNNFTHKVLYDADACILQESTLKKLLDAQNEFKSLGYKIKSGMLIDHFTFKKYYGI
ncbi:Peptidase M15D vanX D-ala-D-ala dipeptidase [Candidatus Arthromitus sp. SFB-4]|nr:Peptidase M15D vanX D-ala-D-ala dipeptidase [Candidatus Arthromitus sp. SFB-4]